jgi:hypothetical protein
MEDFLSPRGTKNDFGYQDSSLGMIHFQFATEIDAGSVAVAGERGKDILTGVKELLLFRRKIKSKACLSKQGLPAPVWHHQFQASYPVP